MMTWIKAFGEKMQKNIINNLKIHSQIMGELVFFFKFNTGRLNLLNLLFNCSCSHDLFSESYLPLN